jgi:arylsulfate sulfotransferase
MNPRRFSVVLAVCVICALTTFGQAQTNASTTALTATPSTISPGASVTLSAMVQVAGGDPAPTGTVQFTVNGQSVASAALANGTARLAASSAGIAPGTYPVVANYGGDANTVASHSAAVPVTISDYTSTTTLVISQPVVARGQTATATATVTSSSGQPPTGTVTFSADGNALATVALTNGVAKLTGSTTTLVAAVYPVKAVYNGNTATKGSTSAAVDFTVKGVTATAFSATPPVLAPGATTTLHVAITTNGGTPATGTVQFYSGTLLLTQTTLAGGVASLTVPSKGYPAGLYAVTAKYLGDARNEPSSGTTTVSLETTTTSFTITPAGAALATSAATQFSVTPAAGSKVTWYVNGIAGGSAATGTIDSSGNYTAPSAATPASVLVSAAEASAAALYSAPVPVYVVVPGSVGPSNTTEVAAYTINAPAGGEMSVEFGPTNAYGRNTWQQPTPSGGGAVRMLVAGMTAPATWHMSASVNFGNGLVYNDPDHSFVTALPFNPYSTPTVTLGAGMTPQPGFEMVNPAGNLIEAYDLQGNFIWGLQPSPAGAGGSAIWQPIKLLPNGHLLTQFSPESSFPVDGSIVAAGTIFAAYEMQLDGAIVKQVTLAQLNANLAASGYKDGLGNLPTLLDIHHDVTLNPVTGHWLMIANTTRVETNDPGTTGPTTVLGDVLLDVDPNNNFKVDWVWNTFDHMDVTRHPTSVTDWTHTNAIVYSADDHNILVSMRYQNWVLKVDYDDGAGAGDILWHFGYQGDFTLVGGASPQDWVFGQHLPSFTTANTTGVFGLTMMDNGDGRVFGADPTCPVALTNGVCYYSRAPQFTVDETAMTATLNTIMPFEGYSFFGGNAEILANGDAHADFCSVLNPTGTGKQVGYMLEYTGGDSPQFVWSLDMNSAINAYRGQRWGSFYPGVTWAH